MGQCLNVKGKGYLEDDYTQEEISEAENKLIGYEDNIEVVDKFRKQFEKLTAKYDLTR